MSEPVDPVTRAKLSMVRDLANRFADVADKTADDNRHDPEVASLLAAGFVMAVEILEQHNAGFMNLVSQSMVKRLQQLKRVQ